MVASCVQVLPTSSQLSKVQAFASEQVLTDPPPQNGGLPAWQVVPVTQNWPSSQGVPTSRGVNVHPPAPHVSVVQGLESLHNTGVPLHMPVMLQTSPPVQGLPSSHGVPAGTGEPLMHVPDTHMPPVKQPPPLLPHGTPLSGA
jgi:hypothetical protein